MSWTENIITREEIVPIYILYGPDFFSFYTVIFSSFSTNFTFRDVAGIASYQGILFKKACNFLVLRETKPFKDKVKKRARKVSHVTIADCPFTLLI